MLTCRRLPRHHGRLRVEGLEPSAELTGEYGEAGLFAGVPCVIGASGVEEVVELPLTDEEKATFHACCEGIRHNMEHLKEI